MSLDELNRSWLRRGLFNPAPWASSTPSVWMETEIFIVRTEMIADEFHGFEGDDVAMTVWSAFGHVDQTSNMADDEVLASGGFVVSRKWDIILPVPPSSLNWPIKGDVVAFDSSAGQPVQVVVDDVMLVDQNDPDHLELMGVEIT